MPPRVHIYRSATLLLLGIVTAAGACIGSILRLYYISGRAFDAEQAALYAFVLFSAIATFLHVGQFRHVDPVVSLLADRVVLQSMWQPRQCVEIPRGSLIYVTTNALSGRERSDLIFTVTEECFAQLHHLPIWRTTEENKLYFELVNAQVSASKAATLITAWMHHVELE